MYFFTIGETIILVIHIISYLLVKKLVTIFLYHRVTRAKIEPMGNILDIGMGNVWGIYSKMISNIEAI